MKKYVLGKIALLTLGLAIAASIVVFAFLSFAAPGVMAGWCEKTGNYSLAATYSSLLYKYTGDVEDADRCVKDSILSGKEQRITEYGVQFIDHDDFEEYCDSQDEYYLENYGVTYSYKQYIYGEIASAYYSLGDTQYAIGCAIEALDPDFDRAAYTVDGQAAYTIDGFAYGNALITLSIKVINNSDGEAASYIAAGLENIAAEGEA
ncbi:MAG: hypothetical protein LUD27_06500, partial [Clostridia bacterium]|nr:hypothetical protein [Clostridia bacterium]